MKVYRVGRLPAVLVVGGAHRQKLGLVHRILLKEPATADVEITRKIIHHRVAQQALSILAAVVLDAVA